MYLAYIKKKIYFGTFCFLSGGESVIVAPHSRGKTKTRGIFSSVHASELF